MNNVLVIAAHPDDEILGCGATMAKHISHGDNVSVLILAKGIESRQGESTSIDQLRNHAIEANKSLGITKVEFLDFPDNKMDSVSLLDIVQELEKKLKSFEPNIIYTHSPNDLNIDHQITAKAVLTATRPKPKSKVKEVYFFEVLSSTEWNFTGDQEVFSPNYFVDTTSFINKKIDALKHYESEMLPWPNARSLKAVESLAHLRGSTIGSEAAEAFVVARIIK